MNNYCLPGLETGEYFLQGIDKSSSLRLVSDLTLVLLERNTHHTPWSTTITTHTDNTHLLSNIIHHDYDVNWLFK